jgi:hypothetical protein
MASIGVEPIRPCGHRILSPARLPIPPRGRAFSPGTSLRRESRRMLYESKLLRQIVRHIIEQRHSAAGRIEKLQDIQASGVL